MRLDGETVGRTVKRTYTTRNEAIQREIVEPLGKYAPYFDIEKIADEVLWWGMVPEPNACRTGYVCAVEPDDFWLIVQKCAL